MFVYETCLYMTCLNEYARASVQNDVRRAACDVYIEFQMNCIYIAESMETHNRHFIGRTHTHTHTINIHKSFSAHSNQFIIKWAAKMVTLLLVPIVNRYSKIEFICQHILRKSSTPWRNFHFTSHYSFFVVVVILISNVLRSNPLSKLIQ